MARKNFAKVELPVPSKGMNYLNPPWSIDDDEAVYLQDFLVDKPGELRQRGPVRHPPGGSAAPFDILPCCLAQAIDKTGSAQLIMAGIQSITNKFTFWIWSNGAGAFGLLIAQQNGGVFGSALTTGTGEGDSKPALGGGALIGVSSHFKFNTAAQQQLCLWSGSNAAGFNTTYTGTATMTTNVNSKIVTLAGALGSITNTIFVQPGCFVFDNGQLIGVIKTIDNANQLTLENNALKTTAGVPVKIFPIRNLSVRVVKGRITCAVTSTVVTGSNTKFKDQGLATGVWDVFRASDFSFIGTVNTITNNNSLVLNANAGFACDNERYVAIKHESTDPFNTTPAAMQVGWMNVVHNNVQWYANLNVQAAKENVARVWFSDYIDLEGIDLSPTDGDFFTVSSSAGRTTPITGLGSTGSVLAVFKEDELYAVRGNSPTNYVLEKVADVGALCNSSIQHYSGGLVFTSRRGIHFFDGVQVVDLHESLGDYLIKSLQNYKVDTNRMFSMVYNDHYFVYIENVTPPIGITQGGITTIPTRLTICVNLLTKAISFMTNLDIKGSQQLDASTGLPTLYLIQSDVGGAHPKITNLCDASELFYNSLATVDSETSDGNTVGPRPYWETKRYDFAHPGLLKRIINFIIEYKAQSAISWETVPGIEAGGGTVQNALTSSSTFSPLRKVVAPVPQNQFIGFRIYAAPIAFFTIAKLFVKMKILRENRLT